ncbi:MAG: cytochrome P450 [Sporichthyaceae bacterium]
MALPAPVVFNPFTPEFVADPYAHYAELREADPVHAHPMGVWFLWNYADAAALLRDGRSVDERALDVSALTPAYREASGGRLPRANGQMLMDRDPPDHTRLRGLLTKVFTVRRIEDLRGRVTQLVTEGLDRIAEAGRTELVGDLAFPLPMRVIAELVGLPVEADVRIRELSHRIVMSMEPVMDPAVTASIVAADDELLAFMKDAIERKRRDLGEDLLSGLIALSDADEEKLSAEELAAQVMLLILAGHETTVNLIGNGTLALATNPDQYALLRSRPDLAGNAVEELLRYDSPVQLGRRITTEPYEVGGKTIPARTFVSPAQASANRDPAFWGPDADRLRLDRPNARDHVAFGGGVRHCLGAALARLEGQVYFEALTQRFDWIGLDGDPTRNGLINLRGLDALPLTLP